MFESNSVRNVLLRRCSKNSSSITNAVMSLYDITLILVQRNLEKRTQWTIDRHMITMLL